MELFIELLFGLFSSLYRVLKYEILSWKKTGIDWQVLGIGAFVGFLSCILFLQRINLNGWGLYGLLIISFLSIIIGIGGAMLGKEWKGTRAAMLVMSLLVMTICFVLTILTVLFSGST